MIISSWLYAESNKTDKEGMPRMLEKSNESSLVIKFMKVFNIMEVIDFSIKKTT